MTPTPPRPMARPGRRQVGQDRRDAGALQPRHQPRRADRVEDDDRRHVERLGQRLADGHRAAMEAVEILRRIAAEAGRPVLDQAFRMARARPRRRGRRSAASASSPASGRARVMSTWPSRSSSNRPAEPTEARIAPRQLVGDDDGDRELRPERARRGRRRALRATPAGRGRWSGDATGSSGCAATACWPRCGGEHREGPPRRRDALALRRRGGVGDR